METLVMYYSFSGRTHYEAKRVAERVEGELYEVREQRRRSVFSLYFLGPRQARRKTFVYVEPIAVNLEDYDRVILLAPVWGGWPAPAFNSMVRELKPGMEAEVMLTSDSGRVRDINAVRREVERRGVIVKGVSVIKTEDLKKRDRKHARRRREELRRRQANDKRD